MLRVTDQHWLRLFCISQCDMTPFTQTWRDSDHSYVAVKIPILTTHFTIRITSWSPCYKLCKTMHISHIYTVRITPENIPTKLLLNSSGEACQNLVGCQGWSLRLIVWGTLHLYIQMLCHTCSCWPISPWKVDRIYKQHLYITITYRANDKHFNSEHLHNNVDLTHKMSCMKLLAGPSSKRKWPDTVAV